jgi:serine/threonine protein kinase
LTDFGLSRFIDPSSPYLETRCGSEEYAAPELIMGKRYDGRQTDAWALGVVLYALVTGFLPFVEEGLGSAAGASANGSATSSGVSPSARGSARSRRNYLLKIAKGEYRWPEAGASACSSSDDATRMVDDQVKDLVAGLLCRDPKKRIKVEDCWGYPWMAGPGAPDKRSIKGGGLEGVSVSAFGREDEAMVRSEVPEGDRDAD